MFLIVGCGRLGGSLATRLVASGHEVVVLDPDRRNFEANLPRGFKGRTVEGLAIDNDVLRRAGITQATGVAAVAREESTNIMVADVAKKIFGIARVVVRIGEPRMAALYRASGFIVISPVAEGSVALEAALAKPADGAAGT
jgi:trk system potassium uptake protein TrkA